MHLVFFLYGLAFFLFGFSIFVYPKEETGVGLALDINLLAAFGVVHGINEWVDMVLMGRSTGSEELHNALLVVRTITLVTSFLCLLTYGLRVVVRKKGLKRWVYSAPIVLLTLWTALIVTSGSDFFTRVDLVSRYLLALPGIILTTYALALNIPEAREKKVRGVETHLMLVIGAFACYGFFTGLVVPEANVFPARVLNYRTFYETVGIPVQVFRAICAVVAAYGIVWVLRVFTWRTRVQLEQTREILEHKVHERTLELRVLNEELEQEVAQKTEYESELVESLKEKEALLQELHHRVKNNMQIMISLLKIESRLIEDPGYARLFAESTTRLNVMIAIQERLYTEKSFGLVEFSAFLKDLSRTVFRLYNADVNRIRLTVDSGGLSLNPDTIVPLGMVLHELLSNSIIHGFAGDREGEIQVALRYDKDRGFEMKYRDTGAGLPEDFDIDKTAKLGLVLVKMLCTEQLRGLVEASNNAGAEFTVRFQELKYRERI